MERAPLYTINMHDHLKSKLCDLYENDSIFDKFECDFRDNGQCVSEIYILSYYTHHFCLGI